MQNNKVEIRCPHFGICGGCAFQNVPYKEQLKNKEMYLKNLFADYIPSAIPIEPSSEIWHYRNKIDPVFSREHFETPPPAEIKRRTVLGFKRFRRWYDTFPMEDCLIGPCSVPDLLKAIHQWREENRYEAYDRRTKEGILHALLIRQSRRTSERMVGIVTRELNLNWESLIEQLNKNVPCQSIYGGLYTRTAEVSQAQEWHLIHGQEVIHEKIVLNHENTDMTFTFRISPASFFQANTLSAEKMFLRIYQWTREITPEYIFDLYGGMGTIGIILSHLASKVFSVDCVPSSIEDGKINAELNNVVNVEFYLQKVRRFLSEQSPKFYKSSSSTLVIVDPPREGLTLGVIKKLTQWRPKDIIYVSCNPKALIRELPYLLEYYQYKDGNAYDFFPHTPHFETLLWLSRK
ncbi:MAG TPA: 23S rRNA (uracil(1939)-C(5))-methyltransferase RlmD [Candidatus Hydrogenedens sp.]|nr:23S rRNA (uracil(1939)-C(5))-methyltransferase RlmD [Candidatus Hydrogenedens sp.]